jgi:hypothetical protein
MSTTVRAIEARRLIGPHIDRMATEGMPIPHVGATGGEFANAFDRWLVDFTNWLRLPSRG